MHETKGQIKAGPVTGFMKFSDMNSLAENTGNAYHPLGVIF